MPPVVASFVCSTRPFNGQLIAVERDGLLSRLHTLPGALQRLYHIPLREWRRIDREKLPGLTCNSRTTISCFPRVLYEEAIMSVAAIPEYIAEKISVDVCSPTEMEGDAIVCPARETLMPMVGQQQQDEEEEGENINVADTATQLAVYNEAGRMLRMEMAGMHGGCYQGECAVTKGYSLASRFIIHAVPPTPVDSGSSKAAVSKGHEEDLLRECYRGIFSIVSQNVFRSVSLCPLYRNNNVFFAREDVEENNNRGCMTAADAARIAVEEMAAFMSVHSRAVNLVLFACRDQRDYNHMCNALRQFDWSTVPQEEKF